MNNKIKTLEIMSVQTKADEKREEAKSHISKAISCLLMIIDDETHGSDNFRADYKAEVARAIVKTLEVQRMI